MDTGSRSVLPFPPTHVNRERFQEEYLLLPRTEAEVLTFCRVKLGLSLPSYPVQDEMGTDRASSTEDDGRTLGDALDDTLAADMVSREILSWGSPFRTIETDWRLAASPGSYAIAFGETRCPAPRAHCRLLCSAREMSKGEPPTLVAPGLMGAPFAVDFSAVDVRWLKDQWK